MEGNNASSCVSSHSPGTYSLTTSPQNFSAAMQMLEPLDNDEQTHFLMNNSFNGMGDDSDHSVDDFNILDINKTKFQSFGIYIGK